jgi:hypothetical protein
MFDNDHPFLGLIDENRPAIHHQCGEPSREVRPGNNAESNESSPQGPQQHCDSGANQTKQRKQPSTRSDKRKRQRNKQQRIKETTSLLAGSSCASLCFYFLLLPTNASLEFLS